MPNYRAELIGDIGQIMEKYGLTKVSIVEKELVCTEIILEKTTVMNPAGTGDNLQVHISTPNTSPAQEVPPQIVPVASLSSYDVAAPMVGVFYASPSPEADPFVRIGDKVKKGDVLCILEAMKLMNEIQAEQDGKIVDVCAKNGDVVEFGQVLFKLDVSQ